MSSAIRRRLRTLLTLGPVVLGAVGLAVAGVALARQVLPLAALRESNDVVGSYLQTVGTIYAVLLAFVVYVVWSQYNDARLQVEREANELVDLHRTVRCLPASIHAPVQGHLERYAELVVAEEWAAMAGRDEESIERIGRHLELAWTGLEGFEPVTRAHEALYAEALSRFNDLSDVRTLRLTSARVRIPFAMKLLLCFGAITTVASLGLFAVDSFAIHALMAGAVAGAVSHILYLIADLDDCFAGDWQISPAPFERARSFMARAASDRADAKQ